jgi:hypothetical protein
MLAAALAKLGRVAEAAADHVLQIEPGFTIRGLTRLAYSDENGQRGPLPAPRRTAAACAGAGFSPRIFLRLVGSLGSAAMFISSAV